MAPRKPQIQIRSGRLSLNPSKNYILNLLADDIRRLEKARTLDAGCGQLRNYWMFASYYAGIGIDIQDALDGLSYGSNAQSIAEHGLPDIFIMRLESDLSFLGTFDLCVCTNTIFYTEDPIDVAWRLAARVNKEGALILTDNDLERLPVYLSILEGAFEETVVVHWGHSSLDRYDDDWSKKDIAKLTAEEMGKPNQADGHSSFYIRATGKKHAPLRSLVAPEIIPYRGLYVLKADLPWIKNAHLLDEPSPPG